MEYYWQGLKDYQLAYEQQKQSLLWPMQREEVWGLEHPLVISLGKRSKVEQNPQPDSKIETDSKMEQDISNSLPSHWPIVVSDRGGLATLHSPGQLVIYPLISIARRGWGPRKYVCQLLKITQGCLQQMGFNAHMDEASSGLFIEQKKICFIGLRISNGRVYHGLSLNVSNDLSLFGRISACGVRGRPLTSLIKQGANSDLTPEVVFQKWKQYALENEML